MRRRVVSVVVGLAAGAAAYLITGRYVSFQVGPLIVAAGVTVLAALGTSEFWRANARARRVMAEARASVRRDDSDPGPGGDGPAGPTVTESADATVVYDLDRLRIQISRPRGWRGQHRRTSKAGVR